MQFRIDLSLVEQRRLRLELALDRDPALAEDVDFYMPVWTPGSYLVREYARHIVDLIAVDGVSGAALSVRKTRKNRYRVAAPAGCARIVLRYQVYAHSLTVREAWVDADFAFWNGACVYLWPAGHEDRRAEIRVELPSGWRLYCDALIDSAEGKPAASSVEFSVADLDTAVDTPCLASAHASMIEFEALDRPFRFVCAGLAGMPIPDTLVDDTVRVIERAATVFVDGELPFANYTFLALFGESGRGGLEHKNSSVLLAPRTTFAPPRKNYEDFLGLIAHEFLHVWNVKRLRPVELQSFDYEGENYTRLLWVAEGMTAYYDDLVCLRAGIVDAQTYLETVAGHIRNLDSTPGRFVQSLAEASFDAWIRFYRPDENTRNTTQNYYSNGALVALCLDAKIRSASSGLRSLDHAMRGLYSATVGDGYTIDDVCEHVSNAAGRDMKREIHDLVSGPLDPDLDAALAPYGLELRWQGDTTPYLGIVFGETGVTVKTVLDDTPAWRAGVAPDDELIGLNDLRVRADTFSEILGQISGDGEEVRLLVARQGRLIELRPRPERRMRGSVSIRSSAGANEDQKRLRAQWLGDTSRALA